MCQTSPHDFLFLIWIPWFNPRIPCKSRLRFPAPVLPRRFDVRNIYSKVPGYVPSANIAKLNIATKIANKYRTRNVLSCFARSSRSQTKLNDPNPFNQTGMKKRGLRHAKCFMLLLINTPSLVQGSTQIF